MRPFDTGLQTIAGSEEGPAGAQIPSAAEHRGSVLCTCASAALKCAHTLKQVHRVHHSIQGAVAKQPQTIEHRHVANLNARQVYPLQDFGEQVHVLFASCAMYEGTHLKNQARDAYRACAAKKA